MEIFTARPYTVARCWPCRIPLDLNPEDCQDPFLLHLARESDLLSLIEAVLTAYRELRTARQFDPCHIEHLAQAMTAYRAAASTWRDQTSVFASWGTFSSSRPLRFPLTCVDAHTSLPLLILASHLFDIFLHACLSDSLNLPTPLGFDVCSHFPAEYSSGILISSKSAIGLLVDYPGLPLNALPAFTTMLITLAYKAVSQSHKLRLFRKGRSDGSSPASQGVIPANLDGNVARTEEIFSIARIRLLNASVHHRAMITKVEEAEVPTIWDDAINKLRNYRERDLERDGLASMEQDAWGGSAFDLDALLGIQTGEEMDWLQAGFLWST